MEYNVFYHNTNGDRIETYDVLRDGGVLHRFLIEAKKNEISRDEFEELLDRKCRYFYWCKCEWETIVSAWVGGDAKAKIDVYQQLKYNWKVFSDICWNFYLGRN